MKIKFKKLKVASAILTSFICSQTLAAETSKIQFSGAVMQSWQAGMEVDGAAANPANAESDSGFHRLRFALNVNAQVSERVSIFAELAEEPNDWNNGSAAISQAYCRTKCFTSDSFNIMIGFECACTKR